MINSYSYKDRYIYIHNRVQWQVLRALLTLFASGIFLFPHIYYLLFIHSNNNDAVSSNLVRKSLRTTALTCNKVDDEKPLANYETLD